MFRRTVSYVAIALIAMALGSVFQPLSYIKTFATPTEQGNCRTFPQTGKVVCGRFLEYWDTHGGLAQQGYPISNTFPEVSELNGQSYTVQYFERAVFELHSENKPPFDVLLSQLGTFQGKRKYPNGFPDGEAPLDQFRMKPVTVSSTFLTYVGGRAVDGEDSTE